jgi:uncharacterized membrane protein
LQKKIKLFNMIKLFRINSESSEILKIIIRSYSMKLRNLAGFGVAVLAAAGVAMISTNALAKTTSHTTSTSSCSKNVKCYGVNKSGTGYVLVTKSACDQIGGSTTNPNASNPSNTNNPAANTNNNPSMTNPGATPPANNTGDVNNNPANTPNGGVTTSNPNQ